MPKLKKQTEYERLLEKIAATGVDVSKAAELPTNTQEELQYEADSVILFWERKGRNFEIKKCIECGLDFAYNYTYETVSLCSNECRRDNLRKIGIDWHPGKPLKERWGTMGKRRPRRKWDEKTKKLVSENYAAYPAVVPPVPLAILQKQLSDHDDTDDGNISYHEE